MQTFLNNNKVLLLGILGAIGIVLQQYVGVTTPDYKVICFGVAIAIISYLANNLRGQWVTILGILGSALSTIATAIQSGNKISWFQLIITIMLAIIAAVAPSGKSVSYENTPTITAAKAQAAAIDAASVPPQTPPVSK